RYADNNGEVAYVEVADAVHRRDPDDVGELVDDGLGDLPQLRFGCRVRRVAEPDHSLVRVVVPHGADEQHLTARGGVRDRVPHLIDRERGVPDSDQPDLTHPSTVPGTPARA